ncbi:MAG: multidrug effflux MFS transporter [Pseudomonadota bacterium]
MTTKPISKTTGLGALSRAEFIVLAALLMSTIALSVDLILPAFGDIDEAFALQNDNDRQAMITVIFLGLMIGQPFFGPMSDYVGRKPAITVGIAIHIVGSLLCLIAHEYWLLLVGRFLQGFGGASARIVVVAVVRDQYVGQQMGKIMSFVLTVFILVPVFAPAIGQVFLLFVPWRFLFAALMAVSTIGIVWLLVRLPETHTNRPAFDGRTLWQSIVTVFSTPTTILYALAAGCAFGTLLSYIVSSQQILQDLYETGDAFAFYFGVTAAFVALSSTINGWLLNRFAMEAITGVAMAAKSVWVVGFLVYFQILGTTPSFWVWMVFITVTMFLVGLTFGNYNAIALRPLGKVAGIASSITATIQTLVSLLASAITGALFAMNVTPVVVSCLALAVIASILMVIARRLEQRSSL